MVLRHYVTSVNIKRLSRLVAIACEDPAGGGAFIARLSKLGLEGQVLCRNR